MKEKSGRCSAESQPPGTSVIMKALKEHRVSKLREPGKERERASLWMTCPASAYSSVLCGLGERVVPSSGGRTTIDESAKQHGRLAVRLGGYTR